MYNFPHCLCPSRPHHREGLQEERSVNTAANSRRESRRVAPSAAASAGIAGSARGTAGIPEESDQQQHPAPGGGGQHHHALRQSLLLLARGGEGGGRDSIFRSLIRPLKDGVTLDGHFCADNIDPSSLPQGGDEDGNTAGGGHMFSNKFRRDGFVLAINGQLTDAYNVETKKLGQGTYGSVSRAINKATKTARAVKTITKAKVKNVKRLRQEIAVMKCLDHPNIVKLFETFEDHKHLYLVLELCKGGELFDRIIEEGFFSETYAGTLMKQVFAALYYIHKNGIVHRDLKPENFLFLDKSKDAPLKIIDFGLAARCDTNTVLATKAGTPYYVAPQVLQGKYTYKCDMWSAGVIMYILLCGYPPFHGENDAEILAKVKSGKFTFNEQDWKNVSLEAKDLIRKLICYDPNQRLSAEQALAHPWIKHYATRPNPEADIPLSKKIVENFKTFRALSKLKKAALTVIAQQLSENYIKDLKNTFLAGLKKSGLKDLPSDLDSLMQEVDSDGSGVIDYTEFIAASLDRPQYVQEDICWAAFRVFDVDANGRITAEELAQVLLSPDNVPRQEGVGASASQAPIMDEKKLAKEQHKLSVMEMRTLILDVDRNGDGEIDFDEFMEMMRKAESRYELVCLYTFGDIPKVEYGV